MKTFTYKGITFTPQSIQKVRAIFVNMFGEISDKELLDQVLLLEKSKMITIDHDTGEVQMTEDGLKRIDKLMERKD